jgi:pyridoxamine 5'-phosphate oxidase
MTILQPGVPPVDPMREFQLLFERAAAEAPPGGELPLDATEMSLATVDSLGRPSIRIVLLKGIDERGFQFYTNYESRKGRELAANPAAALCWRWPWLGVQVRAEGEVERLPAADSDAYFASRPRGHQLGAWASAQSRPLASYAALEAEAAAVEARFAGREVPRPPHWGGFRLLPTAIEFWFGRANRLHERRLHRLRDGAWAMELLSP